MSNLRVYLFNFFHLTSILITHFQAKTFIWYIPNSNPGAHITYVYEIEFICPNFCLVVQFLTIPSKEKFCC